MAVMGPTSDHGVIRRWAESNGFVPAEELPDRVDGEPAELRLVRPDLAQKEQEVKPISWTEFFAKFDQLGLSFVYDDDSTGYNEILQKDGESPYQHPAYRWADLQN